MPLGSPIARIAESLAISSRIVFRLTLPGSDRTQHRPTILTRGGVLVVDRLGDQGADPRGHLDRDPSRHPGHQQPIRLPQPRTDNSTHPGGRGLLNPLLPAPGQQPLADPLGAAFALADLLRQPAGQLVRVGDRALPKPQELPDLGAVILQRAA